MEVVYEIKEQLSFILDVITKLNWMIITWSLFIMLFTQLGMMVG